MGQFKVHAAPQLSTHSDPLCASSKCSSCLVCLLLQNLAYEIILTLGQAFEVAYQLALQARKGGHSSTLPESFENKPSKPIPKPRVSIRKSVQIDPSEQKTLANLPWIVEPGQEAKRGINTKYETTIFWYPPPRPRGALLAQQSPQQALLRASVSTRPGRKTAPARVASSRAEGRRPSLGSLLPARLWRPLEARGGLRGAPQLRYHRLLWGTAQLPRTCFALVGGRIPF